MKSYRRLVLGWEDVDIYVIQNIFVYGLERNIQGKSAVLVGW